jgi:hypothetical protein
MLSLMRHYAQFWNHSYELEELTNPFQTMFAETSDLTFAHQMVTDSLEITVLHTKSYLRICNQDLQTFGPSQQPLGAARELETMCGATFWHVDHTSRKANMVVMEVNDLFDHWVDEAGVDSCPQL